MLAIVVVTDLVTLGRHIKRIILFSRETTLKIVYIRDTVIVLTINYVIIGR